MFKVSSGLFLVSFKGVSDSGLTPKREEMPVWGSGSELESEKIQGTSGY